MGMSTSLYGCIVEYGLYNDLQSRIKNHNDVAIKSLPDFDEWPPLTRQMFSITQDSDFPTTSLTYEYQGRAIHFGGQFKSIEYEWRAWKEKFENLLTKLIWREAFVHFQTGYADLQIFKWQMDTNKWAPNAELDFGTIKREYWNYEGDPAWENLR
jgi:hypothetical protein